MSEPKKYRSERKKEKILLEMPDGTEKPFFLCEMEGDLFEDYMDENKDRLETLIDEEKGTVKIVAIKSYKGMYSSLLCRCMTDVNDAYVTQEFISGLPLTTRKGLFEDAQRLNAITEDGVAEVKN